MDPQYVANGILGKGRSYWLMQRYPQYRQDCTCCSKRLCLEAIPRSWGRGETQRPPNRLQPQADQSGSVWVFVLLAVEAIKTYKTNPYFRYPGPHRRSPLPRFWCACSLSVYKIPTWTTPLVITLLVTFLVPNTSLIGHLCSVAVGYLCSCPYFLFKLLVLTSRRSRSRLLEPFGATGEGASLDRGEDESAREVAALRLCGPKDLWKIRCTTFHRTCVGCHNRECRAVDLYGLYSAFRPINKTDLSLRCLNFRRVFLIQRCYTIICNSTAL